jgi:predicted amidohydrolase YtcJ
MAVADLLFTNVSAVTMDPARPRADALAVVGNRIVFVGSAADGANWRGAQTRVIDGNGATLLPGLIDSHFHLQMGALQLRDLHLEQVHTLDALAAAVRQYAQATPSRPSDRWSSSRLICTRPGPTAVPWRKRAFSPAGRRRPGARF